MPPSAFGFSFARPSLAPALPQEAAAGASAEAFGASALELNDQRHTRG